MLSPAYKSHYKANLVLAFPVILSQLGHVLVSLCDNIMVAQLGTVQLDAAALANSIFTIALVCGLGISFSITPLVAAASERKNKSRVTLLLVNGVVLCTLFGIFLALAGYFFSETWLRNLHQPEEVVALAIPYILILFGSLVPLMPISGNPNSPQISA